MIILLSLLIFVLIDAVIILCDGYRYPACPRCGNHGVGVFGELYVVKRIKGKIICPFHGEVERRK